jgi:hypothetical protein
VKKSINRLIFGVLGILLIFMVIGIFSFYSESENQLPIEMVAFNSLTDEESALIPVSPKDSIVKKVPINDDIKTSIDNNYGKDQVYSVTFNNTDTDSSGKLVVFVSLDKKTVLGKGFTSKYNVLRCVNERAFVEYSRYEKP